MDYPLGPTPSGFMSVGISVMAVTGNYPRGTKPSGCMNVGISVMAVTGN